MGISWNIRPTSYDLGVPENGVCSTQLPILIGKMMCLSPAAGMFGRCLHVDGKAPTPWIYSDILKKWFMIVFRSGKVLSRLGCQAEIVPWTVLVLCWWQVWERSQKEGEQYLPKRFLKGWNGPMGAEWAARTFLTYPLKTQEGTLKNGVWKMNLQLDTGHSVTCQNQQHTCRSLKHW